MKGDFHVRFRERLGLKCSCLLDKEKAKTKAMQLKTVSLKIMADAFAFFVPADWNGGCMM